MWICIFQGRGVYRYIGAGENQRQTVGQLRTRQRLDSHGGPSSLEITIQDTGTITISIILIAPTLRVKIDPRYTAMLY